MSAIGGIFPRRGQRPDERLLDALSTGLRRIGPDGEVRFRNDCVAMLHRPFHTTRTSRLQAGLRSDPEGIVVACDGRLDNARELGRALGVTGAGAVEVITAAYQEWGVAAFAKLVGDFSFALWDAPSRALLLCTDGLGRTPLYYRVTDAECVWSTSGRSLAAATMGSLAPDPDYVADYLVNRISGSSPYTGVNYLPGGHYLRVTGDRCSVHRYWSLDTTKELRYTADVDYEAHFLELFDRAVSDRLDSEGPIFCELSGGVDSSSIVCTAKRLADESDQVDLRTVSYVFDSATTSDERQFINVVEDYIGRPGLHLSETEHPIFTIPDPTAIEPEEPTAQLLYLRRQDHLAKVMSAANARVILSGIGGDQMFLSENVPSVLPLADHIVRLALKPLLRDTYLWSRTLHWPLFKTLWLGGLQPLAPRQARGMFMPAGRLSDFIDPEFSKRTNLSRRFITAGDERVKGLPSRQLQYWALRFSMRPFALNRCLSVGCADVRYPYFDRRLVEFALSLPLDQKARPGETRSIVRRAFAGRLPELIRQRRSKAGPTEAVNRAFVAEWSRWALWLADSRVAAYGYVKADAFQQSLARARHGVIPNSSQLGRIMALEVWLRSLECSAKPASSHAA
ncbi:MAG: hypothetical protein K2Y23_03585 [Cyanobacteria bacterium]|nr:hypothetical protein [Cyanobacteriota bacterium]